MKNVLHIQASPNKDESSSIKLAESLINKIKKHHNEINLYTINLFNSPPSHLTSLQLSSFFTPLEKQSEEQKKSMDTSNSYIENLKKSDIIIFSYPVWNFLFPSSLKAWIDQIVRPGVSFRYNENHAPEGLIINKKAYIVATSGGISPDTYNNDVSSGYDFSVQYLQTVLNYIGFKDITVIRAQGLATPNLKDKALKNAMETIIIDG